MILVHQFWENLSSIAFHCLQITFVQRGVSAKKVLLELAITVSLLTNVRNFCFCKHSRNIETLIITFQIEGCKNPKAEEAVDCPVPCDETCEGKPAAGCIGSTDCRKGCRCRQGLVRNKEQQCIPPRECRNFINFIFLVNQK